jgi:transcription elongation GreA/GreB family factor
LPDSFAWWERYFVYSQGPRVRAITAVDSHHQSLGDAETAGQSDRTARTNRELKGLAVLLTRAPIMKVASRHEGDSKIGEQVSCSRRRCRWPHLVPVPEVLSGSLRWAK